MSCPPRIRAAVYDGPFDALAFFLIEDLGVREVGMLGTTLEAKDLLEDFEVRRLELGAAFSAEGSRNTTL